MEYQLNFTPIWEHRDLILQGLATTVALSISALVIAGLIGLVIGSVGTARSRSWRALAALYVEVMRNIPLLVHMYFWYMALAFLQLPAFVCAMLGLALYSGAYVGEVVRSGIGSIPNGQMHAGLALGLRYFQTLRFVIYPQAFASSLPRSRACSPNLSKTPRSPRCLQSLSWRSRRAPLKGRRSGPSRSTSRSRSSISSS